MGKESRDRASRALIRINTPPFANTQCERPWRRTMFIPRLAAALALSCAACASPQPLFRSALPRPDTTEQAALRGQQFVTQACAGCHAMGAVGDSPMADATPFRAIVHRYPLDRLEEAFAEGLVTSHPAMPAYVFRASEIDDLIAYLQTVKSGP